MQYLCSLNALLYLHMFDIAISTSIYISWEWLLYPFKHYAKTEVNVANFIQTLYSKQLMTTATFSMHLGLR